ncbi:conserved protein of unknown function [Methylocella tundrae]|uniref:Uncharacterized protein n=1 Tax=Methylocella tundrae TaxID=227605 RepID=A0A4U8Z331_METTU|nr:conserved protein of unknown function [Methylocella tundrae]
MRRSSGSRCPRWRRRVRSATARRSRRPTPIINASPCSARCRGAIAPRPRDFGGDGDSGGAADVVETANPEASVPAKERRTSHGRHYRSHATRHYHHYGHYHGRSHSSASETHHKGKTLAFNVISGRAKTR